eukprot:scaffold36847_cov176-Amphora_coffeaeformis.AAC.3
MRRKGCLSGHRGNDTLESSFHFGYFGCRCRAPCEGKWSTGMVLLLGIPYYCCTGVWCMVLSPKKDEARHSMMTRHSRIKPSSGSPHKKLWC